MSLPYLPAQTVSSAAGTVFCTDRKNSLVNVLSVLIDQAVPVSIARA